MYYIIHGPKPSIKICFKTRPPGESSINTTQMSDVTCPLDQDLPIGVLLFLIIHNLAFLA